MVLCIAYFYDTFVTIQFFSIIYTYSKKRRKWEKSYTCRKKISNSTRNRGPPR